MRACTDWLQKYSHQRFAGIVFPLRAMVQFPKRFHRVTTKNNNNCWVDTRWWFLAPGH